MPRYCVSTHAQPNGDHEIHDVSLNRECVPAASKRVDLGWLPGCFEAMRNAKDRYYRRVSECSSCTEPTPSS